MTEPYADLLSRLTSISRNSMLDAKADLRTLVDASTDVKVAFARACALAMAASGLSARERHLRLGRVIQELQIGDDGYLRLAKMALTLLPETRAVIASLLPPHLKQHAYSLPVAGKPDYQQALTLPVLPASTSPPLSSRMASGEAESESDHREAMADIVILSEVEPDANRAFLRSRGYFVHVVKSLQDLTPFTDPWSGVMICAFIVDQSILTTLSRDQQRHLVRVLSQYSTFAWIRLDGSGDGLLLSTDEVFDTVRESRCQRRFPCDHEISISLLSTLHVREMEHVKRALRILSFPRDGLFRIGNLNAEEERVLVGASALFAQENMLGHSVDVRSIRATVLAGGRSSDKVLALQVDDQARPIVAKVGNRSSVIEEAQRYFHFVQEPDRDVRQLHFHGSSAVLIYPLVTDDIESSLPAPTLEQMLHDIWLNEQGFISVCPLTESELVAVIRQAAGRLFSFNRRPAPMSQFPAVANPWLQSLDRLERGGVTWGFDEEEVTARVRASETLRELSESAVVHGDVHLRNVLVTSKADCAWIDFSGTGPGHPAVDLVRFELALQLTAMKQTSGYDDFVQLQREISLGGAKPKDLENQFPAIASSKLNRICLAGSIEARDLAHEAVKAHRGDAVLHYRAMKLAVAWQALPIEGLQQGLARAAIQALSR